MTLGLPAHTHLRYICDAETKDKMYFRVWVMRGSTVLAEFKCYMAVSD